MDITPYATPGRYRFLSLENLHLYGDFEIFEFENLPHPKHPTNTPDTESPAEAGYTAVSYVWRGLPLDDRDLPATRRALMKGNFTVKGGEDADPISIAVLEDIVWADSSLQGDEGGDLPDVPTKLLWLDQLCIMQTSDDDKAWQISQMYEIYKHSYCLVLPGGLTRLVSPEDSNNWMSRAWTLQEVVAPERGFVAMLCMADQQVYDTLSREYADMTVKQSDDNMFITYVSLLDLTSLKDFQKSFGFTEAGVQELSRGTRKWSWVSKATESDIWRSNWSRTSSRPVDMVFSIMQCFGVTLPVKQFDKNDRVRATIALAQEILKKPDGRANWLDSLWYLPPAPQLSIFPQFPETRVDGKGAVIRFPDGSMKNLLELMRTDREIVEFENVSDEHISDFSARPTMDDSGYYTFVASSIYVIKRAQKGKKRVLDAGDGSRWVLSDELPDAEYRRSHPEVVKEEEPSQCTISSARDISATSAFSFSSDEDTDSGLASEEDDDILTEEYYPDLEDIEGDFLAVLLFNDFEIDKTAYMLLEKHGPRKYHRLTHLIVDGKKYDPFRDISKEREDVRISIGPFPGHRVVTV